MTDLGSLPDEVAALIGEAEVVPVTVGMSSAVTARICRNDGEWFLKVQPVDALDTTLVGEGERLRWLAPHVPVPDVVHSGTDGVTEWLLTRALPGNDATSPEHQGDIGSLVQTLARGLRRFHDQVPVGGCPFDATTATDIERARARVAAGLVDPTDFEPIHRGMSAGELFDLLVESQPGGADDQVVLHGDYCVPNVVLHERAISGYVDLGRAGVGDRHRDLGIACRSIAHNFGGHAVGLFVDAYDLDRLDLARLDFFVMLDEFF